MPSNVEFVLSACECRNRIMNKPTKSFARRALAGTNQETLKGSVVHCVKFLRHEKECVPKHLIFEMNRTSCNDDRRVSDPWHDTWMDMALIDALPFTYEPRRKKTGYLHMRKQRRRSASR